MDVLIDDISFEHIEMHSKSDRDYEYGDVSVDYTLYIDEITQTGSAQFSYDYYVKYRDRLEERIVNLIREAIREGD